MPGRKVSQVSHTGEVLCGLDAKDDRIVHLRAIQKGACADLTCRLDDHASSIRRCAFTPSDRLVTCDATGNLRVWHWERLGEVLPSPPKSSPYALGTDDAFCKDQTQLGWDDMGDPAVSAYLPEHRGCSMKLDVVAGAVWCLSLIHI